MIIPYIFKYILANLIKLCVPVDDVKQQTDYEKADVMFPIIQSTQEGK